jgi:hypothetical protein
VTRLLIDVTAHGLGHLAQIAPVAAELGSTIPGLDLTIRSGLPPAAIAARVGGGIRLVAAQDGFGLVMRSPFEVDRAATMQRYRDLHAGYGATVAALAAWIARERFDAVLSNVSYAVLAAARRAGIPALAFSSLNWADMFSYYCGGFDGAAAIASDIHAAYAEASLVCRLVPGMPMPGIAARPITELIVTLGADRRSAIRAALAMADDARIIVFAFGGLVPRTALPWDERLKQRHLLFGPDAWRGSGPWRAAAESGVTFTDLIASADLVVTKPGYGIVSEVAAAGTAALLVSRGDWPEEPDLFDWLGRHGRHACLDGPLERCTPDLVFAHCEALARRAAPPRPQAGGERRVAQAMRELVG